MNNKIMKIKGRRACDKDGPVHRKCKKTAHSVTRNGKCSKIIYE